jgi:hypothetical protein
VQEHESHGPAQRLHDADLEEELKGGGGRARNRESQ